MPKIMRNIRSWLPAIAERVKSTQTDRIRPAIIGCIETCAVVLVTAVYVGSGLTTDAAARQVVHHDTLGSCDQRRYLEYFVIAQDIGGLVIGQSPGFEEQVERAALRAAINQIEFPEGATTFVVAHDPSAKVYAKTCTSKPCSIEEVSYAETQCLEENLDLCYFAAVRHNDQTYCLLYGD